MISDALRCGARKYRHGSWRHGVHRVRHDHRVSDPRSKYVPPLWVEPIEEWATWLAAGARATTTIATRSDHLRRTARAMGGSPWSVTDDDLIAWAGRQKWARETRRALYASMRSFWGWAAEKGFVSQSPAAALPRVPAALPHPRPCPEEVVSAARWTTDRRVALMVRLGAELGMRRSEIAIVHADDLFEDLGGWSLTVHGKGDKDRNLPLTDDLTQEIRTACTEGGGWAFPGRIDGHLSARWVGKLLAGHLPDNWTAHTLRHRFGTVVWEATGDLLAASQLLGHASTVTTQTYVQTNQHRLRVVAATASNPTRRG